MREKIVASWSSGKDGAMALEYVLEGGFEGVATFGFSQSLRKAFCRAALSRREKGRSLQSGLEKVFEANWMVSALSFLLAAALFRLICGSSRLRFLTLLHNAYGDNIDLFDLLWGEECG